MGAGSAVVDRCGARCDVEFWASGDRGPVRRRTFRERVVMKDARWDQRWHSSLRL